MRVLLRMIAAFGLVTFVCASSVHAQRAEAGRQVFASRCAACHGTGVRPLYGSTQHLESTCIGV